MQPKASFPLCSAERKDQKVNSGQVWVLHPGQFNPKHLQMSPTSSHSFWAGSCPHSLRRNAFLSFNVIFLVVFKLCLRLVFVLSIAQQLLPIPGQPWNFSADNEFKVDPYPRQPFSSLAELLTCPLYSGFCTKARVWLPMLRPQTHIPGILLISFRHQHMETNRFHQWTFCCYSSSCDSNYTLPK